MTLSRISWWFLSILLAFGQAYATLTNITVDDTNSTYFTFVGSWNAITPSTPCTSCFAQPDAGLAYNSTWHDGSLLSGTFSFQGTAVYIYGIDVANPANVTFAMSNPTTNSFHYFSADGFVYNSLFFSATGLDASVSHTVSWLLEQSSVGGNAALFDYAVVTLDVPDASSSSVAGSSSSAGASSTGSTSTTSSAPSQSSSGTVTQAKKKTHTGAIVGAVVGVIVGLALVGALFLFLRRRQSSEVPAGTTDSAHNFHGSDAGPNRRPGYTGYTVEPYQPPDLPRPGPFAHSEADSGSMSGASMAAVRSAPISNITGGPPHTVPFQPPVQSVVPSDTPDTSSLSAGSTTVVRPEPVSRPLASSPSSKRVPVPVTLAWDPNDPSGQRARDLDVQERLRHLEELVAASQPPSYS
ncbi:hypothetical protein MSAN_02185500 [Mycena sanguinolenta]|uniref:Uncharacterized protein n=1 Tax=Mycena sanguinolenta TaxID=230812 RepID=A0A8H7CKP5_9AGAR|nr:hypothetical protein MSAN_02185500 [Mycena sanguinolenta]